MANNLLRPLALLLAVLGCALCPRADATAFEVGGDDGWVVPPASDGGRYNQWASKNRFLVGDVVRKRERERERETHSDPNPILSFVLSRSPPTHMHGPPTQLVQTSSTARTRCWW
jgi:hypothetical protein